MKKLLIGFVTGILVASAPLAFAYSNLFKDVDEGVWYTESIETLADYGVVEGYGDGSFRPGNSINRAETTVMFNRMLEFIELNYDQFPVVEAGEPFERNYRVCDSPETGLRIYETYYCGDDSCSVSFYDHMGNLIEDVPEGDGAGDPEPNTSTTNCQHTTEEYFTAKVE